MRYLITLLLAVVIPLSSLAAGAVTTSSRPAAKHLAVKHSKATSKSKKHSSKPKAKKHSAKPKKKRSKSKVKYPKAAVKPKRAAVRK